MLADDFGGDAQDSIARWHRAFPPPPPSTPPTFPPSNSSGDAGDERELTAGEKVMGAVFQAFFFSLIICLQQPELAKVAAIRCLASCARRTTHLRNWLMPPPAYDGIPPLPLDQPPAATSPTTNVTSGSSSTSAAPAASSLAPASFALHSKLARFQSRLDVVRVTVSGSQAVQPPTSPEARASPTIVSVAAEPSLVGMETASRGMEVDGEWIPAGYQAPAATHQHHDDTLTAA